MKKWKCFVISGIHVFDFMRLSDLHRELHLPEGGKGLSLAHIGFPHCSFSPQKVPQLLSFQTVDLTERRNLAFGLLPGLVPAEARNPEPQLGLLCC